MTEATIHVEDLMRDVESLIMDETEFSELTLDISCENDYKQEVKRLADKVLNRYDQDENLSERIDKAVDTSKFLSGAMWKFPILYNYNGICGAERYVENSLGPIEGLASACLRGDVKAEVEKRRETSEDETSEGGCHE
jgi:hypothetical protein